MKMILHTWLSLVLGLCLWNVSQSQQISYDEAVAKFLGEVNYRLAELYNAEMFANWNNEIYGPNDLRAKGQSDIATTNLINYIKEISPMVSKFKRLTKDEGLRQQLAKIPAPGYDALYGDDLETLNEVTSKMRDIYKNAKLCSYREPTRCDLKLIPDVQNIIHTSKDVKEIEYYWIHLREVTGISAKPSFLKFGELYKKTSGLNGFNKPSDFWVKDLEESGGDAMRLSNEIVNGLQPLFLQFHAHIRSAMRKIYGSDLIKFGEPYPQSLAEIFIGNSYDRTDGEKLTVALPYPQYGLANITSGLLNRGINNAELLFLTAAEFYHSMGFPKFEDNFWLNHAQPNADPNEEMQLTCLHKAFKYYGGVNQVDLSYCPQIDEIRYTSMYEVISDIHYYRAYQQTQPTLFQEEPLPNFSDAIARAFSLAASSPRYLERTGLHGNSLQSLQTLEARINRMYIQGLRTFFLIPIFYVLDRYRMDFFDGRIDANDNCAYWKLTEQLTGASPPVTRTNADFDIPSKLLMEVDDQYTSLEMSIILQFQLYRSFCLRTGQYVPGDPRFPLDLCDLSNQTDIGPLVRQAMSLGASKSYKEILQLLTNESSISLNGILEYFQPLLDWLVQQNLAENAEIGWQTSTTCTSS